MSEWRPKYNHWAIAFTVTLATFMEVLDTSIANVALPHIAGSLSEARTRRTWVLTVVPGVERHRAAVSPAGCRPLLRAKALLHDLRGAVHRQLVPVRPGAEPAGC